MNLFNQVNVDKHIDRGAPKRKVWNVDPPTLFFVSPIKTRMKLNNFLFLFIKIFINSVEIQFNFSCSVFFLNCFKGFWVFPSKYFIFLPVVRVKKLQSIIVTENTEHFLFFRCHVENILIDC